MNSQPIYRHCLTWSIDMGTNSNFDAIRSGLKTFYLNHYSFSSKRKSHSAFRIWLKNDSFIDEFHDNFQFIFGAEEVALTRTFLL